MVMGKGLSRVVKALRGVWERVREGVEGEDEEKEWMVDCVAALMRLSLHYHGEEKRREEVEEESSAASVSLRASSTASSSRTPVSTFTGTGSSATTSAPSCRRLFRLRPDFSSE